MTRPCARRAAVTFVAFLLAVPPAAPQGASVGSGLAGSWEGWATLVNGWPGHPCRYEGHKDETSVRLELSPADGQLTGSVAIDLPPAEGSGCPPLHKRYSISDVVIGEGVVSLTDSGGHEWSLGLQRQGTVLRGMLAWRQGGAEEPLAPGFAFPDGTKPGSRLSGEVRLVRAGAAGEPTGAAGEPTGAAAGAGTTSAGRHIENFGIVLGATAVGLGLLYGVNKLGKGTADQGVVTCSPRWCVVGAPNEPCFCEGNVVSGASCGTTASGAPIGAPCDYPSVPCEALLSCNSNICEDRFGRCPFQ
jgi:hypothetical protein